MVSCPIGLKRGDLVKVLDHNLKGYEWTIGQVGSILSKCRDRDFSRLHRSKEPAPPLKPGWWVVAVDSKVAHGGCAFAGLPEEHLAPHACTDRCKEHPGRMWTG